MFLIQNHGLTKINSTFMVLDSGILSRDGIVLSLSEENSLRAAIALGALGLPFSAFPACLCLLLNK